MFKQGLMFFAIILSFTLSYKTCCKELLGDKYINKHDNTMGVSCYDTGYFYATDLLDSQTIDFDYCPIQNNRENQMSSQDPFEDDTFIPNEAYLANYYLHLKENMPRNRIGICGYTGIAMFLSFYDSYWYDYFITEQYDSEKTYVNSSTFFSSDSYGYESPGVANNITASAPSLRDLKNAIIALGYNEDSTEFKDELDRRISEFILNQISSNTFLGRLFQIAIDNEIIKSRYIPGCIVNSDYYLNGIGVNNYIMNTILNGYINTNNFIKNKVSVISSQLQDNSSSEKERIRSEIIDIVRTGRPVLMGGNGYHDFNGNGVQDLTDDETTNEYTFGHVVVAYDYDETTDTLFGNMGWSDGGTSHYNLDGYFNIQMSDYWALSIENLLPDRPNNYVFVDKNAYYSPYHDSIYNIMTAIHHGFAPSYGAPGTPIPLSLQRRCLTNDKS